MVLSAYESDRRCSVRLFVYCLRYFLPIGQLLTLNFSNFDINTTCTATDKYSCVVCMRCAQPGKLKHR